MMSLLASLKQASRLVCTHVYKQINHANSRPVTQTTVAGCQIMQRFISYDPYPEYTVDSPYKKKKAKRIGYSPKVWTGGILPRPKGDLENKPLPIPAWKPDSKDQWTTKKALFGQNDYIDILGDGTVHPWQLMKGPMWLRGFRGIELQRLIRKIRYDGPKLKAEEPTKYHNLRKRIWYLYKKHNTKRFHKPYWGGRSAGKSRIDHPREER